MYRTEIINYLIEKNNYKNYLEIGVRNPNDNFNKINCDFKIGVDPNPNSNATFIETSDDFFLKNEKKFDIIFIDGLHLCEQVIKDVENSLKFLNKNGTIVCHDCLPNNEEEQMRSPVVNFWTGDVWKAIAYFRMNQENLQIQVVDADFGCGIIREEKQKLFPKTDISNMNWEFFIKNRNNLMNVITVEQFKTIL